MGGQRSGQEVGNALRTKGTRINGSFAEETVALLMMKKFVEKKID